VVVGRHNIIEGIGVAAGLKEAIADRIDLIAVLRSHRHRDLRALIGLGPGDRHGPLLGVVVGGCAHRVLRGHESARELADQRLPRALHGFGQGQLHDGVAQQHARDVLDVVHRAGLAARAVRAVRARVCIFRGRRNGRHVGIGDGVDDDVARRMDAHVLVVLGVEDLRTHVLHVHIDGEEPAGGAQTGALGGFRFDRRAAFSRQPDVAMNRVQLRAVHDGVHVVHHGGDRQGQRQLAGGRAGLDADIALRLGLNAAAGLQLRAVIRADAGIGHHDAHRQRRQQALAASGLDFGFDVRIQMDVARFVKFVRAVIIAGVCLAADINCRVGDLDVDHVQGIGQLRDIQDAAGLVHPGGDVQVAPGVDRAGFGDGHLGGVRHVEEVGRHALGRVDGHVQLGLLGGLVPVFLLLFLAGKGRDGHVLSDDVPPDLDFLALDGEVHAAGIQAVDHDLVLVDLLRVQDQVAQKAAAARQHHLGKAVKRRVDEHVVREGAARLVGRGPAVTAEGEGEIGVVFLRQIDLHAVLVLQLIGELLPRGGIHGDDERIAARVDRREAGIGARDAT